MLGLGKKFPNFNLTATVDTNLDKAFTKVNNESFKGKWMCMFFYPKDFTFICPTEIVGYDNLHGDFKERNCELYAASTDSEFVHMAWRQHTEDLKNLKTPMISDIKRELSEDLGILDETEGVCYRATFIVDPEGIVRHVSANDLSAGRSPEESLRTLDALQNGGLCPVNWKKGDATL
jgi:peroxiredoxin (alkyl hydroperoxide reductase subunit C)